MIVIVSLIGKDIYGNVLKMWSDHGSTVGYFLYTIMKIDQLIPKTNDIKLLESRLYFKDDCEMSKLLVRIKFL